jgi:hypothetical protein
MTEFTCCECNRHVSVVGPGFEKIPEFRLCAACLLMPGWETIPLLRERLGYNNSVGDECTMLQMAATEQAQRRRTAMSVQAQRMKAARRKV